MKQRGIPFPVWYCSDCGKVVTKDELLEENSYIIEANFEDLKDDIMKAIEKDFKKILKF